MKKLFAIALALLLAVMLAACSSSGKTPSETPAPTEEVSPAETAAAETGEEAGDAETAEEADDAETGEATGDTAETAEEGKDLLARIQERGTIIIGTEGNWIPWTYHDDEDNLTGLDIEIGRRIAAHIGVEAEFAESDWDALLDGIKAGRFDIVCNGVGLTPTRAEVYSFSDPYVYSTKYLIVRADNEDITTLEDLNGRTTANSPSSTYATLAEEYGATVTYASTLQDTIQLLEQGRVDATINSKASIESYLEEHPEAQIKIAAVLPGDPVAYPMDNTEDTARLVAAVNEVLAEMRADGSLAELSIQFLGEDRTNETSAQ